MTSHTAVPTCSTTRSALQTTPIRACLTVFDVHLAIRLSQVNRTIGKDVVYLKSRDTMYFVNLDLVQRPPPQLFAREPTPRMMGPFLPARKLPLGRQYHSVVSFSDIVFDMLLLSYAAFAYVLIMNLTTSTHTASNYCDPTTG